MLVTLIINDGVFSDQHVLNGIHLKDILFRINSVQDILYKVNFRVGHTKDSLLKKITA